jgi:hypothetical protein
VQFTNTAFFEAIRRYFEIYGFFLKERPQRTGSADYTARLTGAYMRPPTLFDQLCIENSLTHLCRIVRGS